MTEKMFREVQPCGMLYTFGREYFLLKPQPVERDSWQGDNAYRWVVVPKKSNGVDLVDEDGSYPFARHVVSNAFTVDYSPDMPVIRIWQLEEIDLTNMEWEVGEGEPMTYQDFAEAVKNV